MRGLRVGAHAAAVAALALLLAAPRGTRAQDAAAEPLAGGTEDCVGVYCARDAIHQFAPAAAFASSLYDGPTTFAEVLRLGDFGLGAVSPLEGEVIILDGTAYHAGPTGEVEILPPSARTPFAFVKYFRGDRTVELPAAGSLAELSRALDRAIPSPNLLYAARIEGELPFVELRSVHRQERPYRPLGEVVREQNVFSATDVRGTLVGFRFPAYVAGVNTDGWHFHFVDEDRRLGGHVLDVRTNPIDAELDVSRTLTLVLPDDEAFEAADLRGGAAAFRDAVRPSLDATRPAPSAASAPSAAPALVATPAEPAAAAEAEPDEEPALRESDIDDAPVATAEPKVVEVVVEPTPAAAKDAEPR